MAITLAPVGLSDAEVTDGIGRGDVACAARLWVRFWPTALSAARRFVDAGEVPGLAAEALIGTVAATAIGRGPREDVAAFVTEAVHELGGDDAPGTPDAGPTGLLVFTSALMTRAFTGLAPESRATLRAMIEDARYDDHTLEALTQLQRAYLAGAVGRAATDSCRRSLTALAVSVEASSAGLSTETWLHLSTCAWCTEGFHELAFSNVALGALIEPAVLATAVAPVAPAPIVAVAPVVPVVEVAPIEEPLPEPAPLPSVVLAPLEAAVADEFHEEHHDEPSTHRAAPVPITRGRGRLAGAVVALVAVAAVVVAVLVAGSRGTEDEGRPVASGTTDTSATENAAGAPTDAVTAVPGALLSPNAPPTELPTTIVAPPENTPTGIAGEVVGPSPSAKPSKSAAAKPTSKPKPTANAGNPEPTQAPTTATPPAESPAATPTAPPCDWLNQLLGNC